MGEGSEAGREDLEELEEGGHFRPVRIVPVVVQRAVAASCALLRHFQGHVGLSQSVGSRVLCHGVAVARVTVHAHALPLLTPGSRDLVGFLVRAVLPFFVLEVSAHADDGHGVGGVAVVASDRPVAPVAPLSHAVADLGQVELVQQVLVEAGVLVDCVVLAVAVTWNLRRPVVELDLIGRLGGAIAELDLLVV